MATKRYLHRLVALGNGPKMSTPYVAKGKRLRMGVSKVVGFIYPGENFWHLSYLCTKLLESSLKDGQ